MSSCKIRPDLNIWHSKLFETLWLEVNFNKSKNFIGVVYRHNGKVDIPYFSRTLEKNLKKMTTSRNKGSNFYIVGDFNIDILRTDEFSNISNFVDFMYSYNSIMFVNKPTRFPIGNQEGSPSILDHFYTNNPQSITNFGIITNGISPDHFGLLAVIENTTLKKKEKQPDVWIRDYKNADIPALRESLSLFDTSFLNGFDIHNKFEFFQSHIHNCAESHIPRRKMTVREKRFQHKPWITVDLQNIMAYRDQLAREVNVENKIHLKPFYNKFRKRLEKKLFSAKQAFFKKKIDEAKTVSKRIWSVINKITCRKKAKSLSPQKIRLNDGTFTDNPEKIANTLNDFFVNIGPDLARRLESSEHTFESYMPNRVRNSFYLSPTDPVEVMNIILGIRNNIGPDLIPG